jgi:hypothetical protein
VVLFCFFGVALHDAPLVVQLTMSAMRYFIIILLFVCRVLLCCSDISYFSVVVCLLFCDCLRCNSCLLFVFGSQCALACVFDSHRLLHLAIY